MEHYVGIRTYVPARSRAEAEAAARKLATTYGNRVWIEGRESASGRSRSTPLPPEEIAAEIEQLDQRFRLTEDQQLKRQAARTLADATAWRRIVSSCLEPIIRSYQNKELNLEAAVGLVDRISIGCLPQDRVELLGTFIYLARRTAAPQLRESHPRYPTCIRTGTADLVIQLKAESPKERVSPGASNRRSHDPSSPLIRRTLEILAFIEWFGAAGPPAASTVDRWVRERRKETGQQLPTGRPRRVP